MNIKIVWTVITMIVIGGGVVSYLAIKPTEPDFNPLMTASLSKLNAWVPANCGDALFQTNSLSAEVQKNCAKQVIANVKRDTGITLRMSDIMNSDVAGHWVNEHFYGSDQ